MRPVKSLLVFLIATILSGCSSNRFIQWQENTNRQAATASLSATDITTLSALTRLPKDTLLRLCTEKNYEQQIMHKLVACFKSLDGAVEYPHPASRQAAVQSYNSSLYQLLSAIDLTTIQPHANIEVSVDKDRLGQAFTEFFFTQEMHAKENGLQPEVFSGLGVTASGFRKNSFNIDDQAYPLEGVFRPFTFYVSQLISSDTEIKLTIRGQLMTAHNRQVSTHTSLAYSPGSAFLTLINKANIDDSSFVGLLRADKAEHRFGIFALQEFSPLKTPILMIHGLNSSPLIWRKLTMAIMNDEQLNGRYQVWHAFYPSGPPPFYNAMRLRKKLAQLSGHFSTQDIASKQINIIGHSMGGIIAKTFAVDTGTALWDTVFSKPPESMQTALTKNPGMQDIFIFKPPVTVQQLFFLDTPHKGSELASSWIGRLGAGLINLPKRFTNMFAQLIEQFGIDVIRPAMRPFLATHGPNSIEVLRPEHPMMTRLNQFPLPKHTWSIVGSDGRLSCAPEDCSNISDGVVAWSSASISNIAQQEILVSSQHNSFQSDQAVAFILEKLRNLD